MNEPYKGKEGRMEPLTLEKRRLIYAWIYKHTPEVEGRRVVCGDIAECIQTAAASAVGINFTRRQAASVVRTFREWLISQGVIGGCRGRLLCAVDPGDLLGPNWDAPPPLVNITPVVEVIPVEERGMGRGARAVFRRLHREMTAASSTTDVAAMRFLTGGKMLFAEALAARLLSAYEAFGLLERKNGQGKPRTIAFLRSPEDWDAGDQNTVAHFFDRVEGGEKLEVKPRDERPQPPLLPVEPPATPVPPTPPSPPAPPSKPTSPPAHRATAPKTVAAGLRGRGQRRAEVKSEAHRLVENPLEVLPVLQLAATRGDSLTVQSPLAVLFHDPRSSCLSLAERINVLDALASKGVIALSAGRKTATILPKKPSSPPPPPEEPVSPLGRLPADQREWFLELWKMRSKPAGTISSPVALLLKMPGSPSKAGAQDAVVAWIRAGLLRDVTKEGSPHRRYLFLIDPTATTLPAGEDASAAEAKAREAQRQAELAAAQAELERVNKELSPLEARVFALSAQKAQLEQRIKEL